VRYLIYIYIERERGDRTGREGEIGRDRVHIDRERERERVRVRERKGMKE
jgi:hypothetical protein